MADDRLEGELEVAKGRGIGTVVVVVDEVGKGDFRGDVDVGAAPNGLTVSKDGIAFETNAEYRPLGGEVGGDLGVTVG